MLYYFNNKFYILVQLYYKEVTVTKDANGYNVELVKGSKKIEDTDVKVPVSTKSVEEAYEIITKSNSRNKID